MTNALVLGKFMPPTLGHKYLIDFATVYPGIEKVYVVVQTNSNQSYNFERYQALREHYWNHDVVDVVWLSENMPQEPEEHPDFWNLWKKQLLPITGKAPTVFASEMYGLRLAEELGGVFVPVDIDRKIHNISATKIRDGMIENWNWVLPEMKQHLRKSITFVGGESCGKTTASEWIAKEFGGGAVLIPEYARGYLNVHGTEVTDEKMMGILMGQIAQDRAILINPQAPILVRDTDLFTTYDLWPVFGSEAIQSRRIGVLHAAQELQSDLYLVMADDLPLVPDPQRYSETRQLTMETVIDTMEVSELNFKIITGRDADRYQNVENAIVDWLENEFDN